ncbi:MAG: YqgE/AlgH family protein [Bacteroidetes bacterium]|nr:YqgE/AlgH family protein [Bacteroidota bacterium]
MKPNVKKIPQELRAGLFLIADPFLADPVFRRSIIYLVTHDEHGSVGFILNQPSQLRAGHVIDGFPEDKTLLMGGPVGLDQVFFIHNCPRVSGAIHIIEDLYWAGDPDDLRRAIDYGLLSLDEILFFNGYSGWGPGQLHAELEEKSWVLAELGSQCLFEDPNDLWKKSLLMLGGHFAWLITAPEHPQLN